jgi:outer membrane protein assembly factor BamA
MTASQRLTGNGAHAASVLFFLVLILPVPLRAQLFHRDVIGHSFSPQETMQSLGATADTILILGNKKTKSFVIRQEIAFKEGDTLSLNGLQLAQQFVYNLQMFNRVNVSVKRFTPSDTLADSLRGDSVWHFLYGFGKAQSEKAGRPYTVVLVEVFERWFIFPQPVFDLRGVSLTQWIREPTIANINFGLLLVHQNLTGYHDQLSIGFGVGFDPFFRIAYSTPYLWSQTRTGFGASFTRRDLNNLALDTRTGSVARYIQQTTGGTLGLSRRLSTFDFISTTFSYSYLRVTDEVKAVQPSATVAANGIDAYPTFVATYTHSKLDFNQCPTDGLYFSGSFWQSGVPNSGGRLDLSRTIIDFRFYKKILGDLSIGFRNYSALSLVDNPVPNHERYFFGYRLILRGYSAQILEGDNLQLNSLELRYPIISQRAARLSFIPIDQFSIFQYGIYLTAFFEAGNLWYNPSTIAFGNTSRRYNPDNNLYSYGGGFVFTGSYRLTARLDFALTPRGRLDIIFSNEVSF